MSYKIKTLAIFEKQAKRLVKKYASLKEEILELALQLKENPKLGTAIGRNCFKIRLAVSSKGKGKSGGVRIITHFWATQSTIYFISIYDKSEQETIIRQKLDELLHCISPD